MLIGALILIIFRIMAHRSEYRWGAKQFLASLEVGESAKDDGRFSWRGLQQVACRLMNEYGCRFIFRTYPKRGYREVVRTA